MSTLQAVLDAFARQALYCAAHGSPFTARLLRGMASALAADEPVLRPLAAWPGDPVADALPLRLAGALHAMVLGDPGGELASHYPGGVAEASADAGLRQAALAALRAHPQVLADYLAVPPQTNEVGRSAVLLGGFLGIAAHTSLPLRLLELGASAGLNLHWDGYRYALGDMRWGDADSPLLLAPAWHGAAPPLSSPTVGARAGCDRAPIDPDDAAQRLRLRAYVWADQHARLQQLDQALDIAAGSGVAIERDDAAAWLERQLARPAPGMATVVYHSIFWSYLPREAQACIEAAMARAGQAASADAPLAWLRFEQADPASHPQLLLSLWPGPRDLHLADAQAHGHEIFWRAAAAAGLAQVAARHGGAGGSPTIRRFGEPA